MSDAGRVRAAGARDSSRRLATASSPNDPYAFLRSFARQKPNQHETSFKQPSKQKNATKPNIVVVLCDDLDTELGSMEFMPKTTKILRDGGANFNNAFTTTPMCCPSRSSFLTGMYVHNHHVYTNNDNCSGTAWRRNHETRSFATYLSNDGYRTGYFGKYLNEYDGSYIPPGWREWVGLIKNSRFYNYSINFNGRKIKHHDNYYHDYFTDLIANDSVTFLKQSKQYFPDRPVAMVLSMPAPHGPEDSAPQYQHLFKNVSTHRTPSWNFAPNMDKQWLLQWTGKMEPIHKEFTNVLHRKRLQTLQSVDDAVQKVYDELKALNQLDNTYIIFTSDHGYHLGQFGLVKGKAMPYEFDIRIPLLIRGPNVGKGIKVESPVVLLDLAPTLLDMGGIETPEHFDGRSVMKLLEPVKGGIKKKRFWRDTLLVERGKITLRQIKAREQYEFGLSNLDLMSKNSRMNIECKKEMYQLPCKKGQKWHCHRESPHTKWRMHKCRNLQLTLPVSRQGAPDHMIVQQCVCPPSLMMSDVSPGRSRTRSSSLQSDSSFSSLSNTSLYNRRGPMLERRERKKQKKFLRDHVQSQGFQPRFLRSKGEGRRRRFKRGGVNADFINAGSASPFKMCHVLPNNSVLCDRKIYASYQLWKEERENVEEMISRFRIYINHLKHIRKHLKDLDVEEPIPTLPNPSITTIHPKKDLAFEVVNPISNNKSATKPPITGFLRPDRFPSDSVSKGKGAPARGHQPGASSGGVIEEAECDCGEHERNFRKWRQRHPWWQNNAVNLNRNRERQDDPGEERNLDDRVSNFRKRENYLIDMLPPVQPPYLPGKDRYFSWNNIRKKDLDILSGETPVAPVINKKKLTRKEKRKMGKDKHFECNIQNMNCFKQDNDHWKTPPLWTLGPFCSCPNSNNNTYWCIRTLNSTHNFLYCEFITGFISYYNILIDPYQLRNAIHDLDYGVLQQLHKTLNRLRACSGNKECTVRARPVTAASDASYVKNTSINSQLPSARSLSGRKVEQRAPLPHDTLHKRQQQFQTALESAGKLQSFTTDQTHFFNESEPLPEVTNFSVADKFLPRRKKNILE